MMTAGVIATPWHCYHRGGFYNGIIAFTSMYFPFLSHSLRCHYLTWVFHTPGTFNVLGLSEMPSILGSSSGKGEEVVSG